MIALADQNGNLIAKYSYDPWGKLLSVTPNGWLDEQNAYYLAVAEANPLRYRGYYYDSETGFYYLQSRYYDPEIGRFINADSYASTDATGLLSTNMFAYCENDPVNRSDPSGEFWATVAKMAVGAAVNVATTVVTNAIAGAPLTEGIGEAAMEGAVTSISGTVIGTAVSVGFSIYRGVKDHKTIKDIAADAALTSLSSLTGGGVGKMYGKLKFNSFISTASKKSMKAWGNELAQKPMGNLYKNIGNWTKDMKRAAVGHYAGSAYGTYLSNLFSSGTTIISTTLHTRPR